MTFDCDSFGPYLRRERERRGLSLDGIVARTKIGRPLLERLERGDLTGWPSGISRRGFFREYVGAIGLDAGDLMADFLRLFPDPAAEPPSAPASEPGSGGALRLTLDRTPAPFSRAQLRGALIDALAIIVAAAVLSALVGHLAAAAAVIAIVYHFVTIGLLGGTPGALVVARQSSFVIAADETARPSRNRAEARRAEPSRRHARRLRSVDSTVVPSTRALG